MPGNWEAVTRCLRVSVVILVFAVLATPLVACEDSEPTTTQAVTEYEDAVYEWIRVAGPSWSDFVNATDRLRLGMREGTGESGFEGATEELREDLDYALEQAYPLRDSMPELPDIAPPRGYEQFDVEFRDAVSLLRQGIDTFIKGLEGDRTMWFDGWFDGWTLLWDGHDAFLDAFCYLPRSSSLSHFCTARLEEAP